MLLGLLLIDALHAEYSPPAMYAIPPVHTLKHIAHPCITPDTKHHCLIVLPPHLVFITLDVSDDEASGDTVTTAFLLRLAKLKIILPRNGNNHPR